MFTTPIQFVYGAATPQTVNAPWVSRFSDAGGANICVLTANQGRHFPAGLYVNTDGNWRLTLTSTDFNNLLSSGANFVVYTNLATPLPVTGTVYVNGNKQTNAVVGADARAWVVVQALMTGTGTQSLDYLDAVIYGDSISNQNFQDDGLNNLYLSKGPIAKGMSYLGVGKILRNFGVSGNTTADMLARISAVISLRAIRPFRAVVMGGTNDASQGVSAAVTIANLQAIYQQLTAAGIPVDAVIYPQRYNASITQKLHHGEVARWHRALRMQNVNVVDAARYIVAADGQVPSNYFFDALIHFSGLGAGLYAFAYYQSRKNFVPPITGPVSANTDMVTLNSNPCLAGNNTSGANDFAYGAGFSGNGPDGGAYALRTGSAIVAVMSKVARTDGKPGEWLRFVVGTPGADGDSLSMSFDTIYRRRAQNTAVSYNRVVIGANGAHYRVTVKGTSANTADPSAAWSQTVGDTVVDGTATLQCVPKIVPGMTVEAVAECVVSGLSGTMGAQPRVRAVIYNTANAQIKIIGDGAWDTGQGLMPRHYPSSAILLRSPAYTFDAAFDLDAATTTTGPHIDLAISLHMDGAALPTLDVGQLALLISPVA